MQNLSWLRMGVVASSLALMSGFVYWRAYAGRPAPAQRAEQKSSAPSLMPGSKSAIVIEPTGRGYPGSHHPFDVGQPFEAQQAVQQEYRGPVQPQVRQPANPPPPQVDLLPGSKSMVISADEILRRSSPAPNQPPNQAQRQPTPTAPRAAQQQGRTPTVAPSPATLPTTPAPRSKPLPSAKPLIKSF